MSWVSAEIATSSSVSTAALSVRPTRCGRLGTVGTLLSVSGGAGAGSRNVLECPRQGSPTFSPDMKRRIARSTQRVKSAVITECPVPATSTNVPLGSSAMAAWACSVGVRRSSRPESTSVGAAIFTGAGTGATVVWGQ